MNFEKYNVNTPEELMEFFKKNLEYGFTCDGVVYLENRPDFGEKFNELYKIRLGEDFIKEGYGVCWDFCELEREFFKAKNIEHECFFMISSNNRAEGGPTHTFALYQQNGKWYWFEYSWFNHRGIWEFDTKEKALNTVIETFREECTMKEYKNVDTFKIDAIKERLNAFDFVEFCLNGEPVESLGKGNYFNKN